MGHGRVYKMTSEKRLPTDCDRDHPALYRVRMTVRAVRSYRSAWGDSTYPICPRCKNTMEREYQRFCDRCGQALDWEGFERAFIVF